MDYKVIKETSLELLEAEVNKNFNLGYDLIGGISTYVVDPISKSGKSTVTYCQAMVKSTILRDLVRFNLAKFLNQGKL